MNSLNNKYIKMQKLFCLLAAFVFLNSQLSFAKSKAKGINETGFDIEAYIESAKTDKVLKIGLVDCIAYALKGNSDIMIKRIEPKLKKDDVKIARAIFEPTLDADYTLKDSAKKYPSVAYPEVFENRDIDFNVSLSGKLTTGTEYDIDFINERYLSNLTTQTINPYYVSQPKVTVTQPLFKDFDIMVNRADIVIAQNNKAVSEENFKNTVMDVINKTKTDYYNYIYYLENYSIAKSSLELAQNLLEINKLRYDKGLVSSVDLLETETAAAQRQKALISAESGLKEAEDELKLVTNLFEDPELWNAGLELIDKPELKFEQVDLVESLKNAFKYRPDYISGRIDLKNKDIKIKAAKNALLPTMDLIGSYTLNGLSDEYRKVLDELDKDYRDWSVGAKFSIPWGSGDRAKFDQRKLEKAQALIAFKKLEQDIIMDVKRSVRLADIQYRQVLASALSKEKETLNHRAQKEKYAAGQISTHDMLDYQDKLAQAELDYIKSLIDYNIALCSLEKAQGLTLAKNNIKLEE
ncbi:MAG: TolC family protein [Candidatus Omnitrophota bacterium]